MWNDSILDSSALEQARLVRTGFMSSEELTRLYLERIERCNHLVRAFVEIQPERALFAARRKDRVLRSRGTTLPVFHGVPTAIKDLNFVRGMWTRMGSRALCVFSPVDDFLTRQVRAGGFVIVGKTSTSEFGTVPITEPDIHPPTRNPWQLDHTSGGSSGGAAAAVAGGLLPIAPGSDGAGSIRIPSAFCHLVGMKPSRGRVPNAFGLPDEDLIYTDGPIARTVLDAAALLDVLSGMSSGIRHWAPPPDRAYAELSLCSPPRLRIRLVTENRLGPVDPELVSAARRAAHVLERLGHHLSDGKQLDVTLEEFLPIWQYMSATCPIADASKLQPVTRWLVESGRRVSEAHALERIRSLRRRTLAWFEGADVVITPTTAALPIMVGALRSLAPEESFARMTSFGCFTAPLNLSGQPAVTVPSGLSRGGLPTGVQLVGTPLGDATVLQLARLLEQAMPWSGRTALLR